MKINIVTNSQKPIGAVIEDLVTDADDVFIASAYISAKAVAALVRQSSARQDIKHKTVDILFGMMPEIDHASLDCLLEARVQAPKRFNVRYTPSTSGRLFHPKLYYFRHDQICHLLIASANLTNRGHHINEEIYCHVECPSSHHLISELNTIRRAWLSEPFSAPLDGAITDLVACIQAGEAAKRAYVNVLSGLNVDHTIAVPPIPPKERLLQELEKGYLISTDFSVAPLSVSIPIRQMQRQSGANGMVIVQANLTASAQLLPLGVCNEFASLYRDAKKLVEQHSILVPPGLFYVPPSAQKSLASSIKPLLNNHKQLIHKYIYLRRPINSHLTQLPENCAKEWQKFSEQPGIVSKEAFLQTAKERIIERREEFRRDPQSAVRLTFISYLHPLVYRSQNPTHAAWNLSEISMDEDLLRTVMALLIGQVDLVIEAAKKKQQPSVQEEYKNARLLISYRGCIIDSLLVKLGRIASRKWTEAAKKKLLKPATPGTVMIADLTKLRKEAEAHRNTLQQIKAQKPDRAFEAILKEYPLLGASAYP